MSAVSTAHSGNIRCSALAIANAPTAATVTLSARASCAFRDRAKPDRRFKKAVMCPVPECYRPKTLIDDIGHGCFPQRTGGLKAGISLPTLCETARKHDGR